jgi:hypothetical protein
VASEDVWHGERVKGWFAAVEAAVVGRADVVSFPESLAAMCSGACCLEAVGARALQACEYAIVDLLMLDGEYPKSMKRERWCWHEDRFSVCGEEYRADFKRKATEIFAFVLRLYELQNEVDQRTDGLEE